MIKDIYLGISIAISWAWGTSLILGMQIAQEKGWQTFLIWAIANTVTLIFFSLLYKRGLIQEKVRNSKIVKTLALLIQCFCLVVQLKIIDDVLISLDYSPYMSYAITTVIGLVFTIGMYFRGLQASIATDNVTTWFTLVALVLCLLFGTSAEVAIPNSSSTDVAWGAWSACILMSGIITDMQHWQRAKANGNGYAFEWAAVIFAIYLMLVYCLAHYQLTEFGNYALLVAVLGVTTSTINSVAVALHEFYNKNVGTMLGSSICIFWGLLASIGVLTIWSSFGIVRVALAFIIVTLSYKILTNVNNTNQS